MAESYTKTSQARRLALITEELGQHGEIFVDALAKRFAVSTMTIHRDLDRLEKNGTLIRTHGGATLAKRMTFEFSFRNQQSERQEAKITIAKKAVTHIRDGHTVMLDTGTTTLEIARALRGKEITVITTSLAIVSELQCFDMVDVILLGGYLRRGSPDMHGPLTADNLGCFRADLAFIGADGIDLDGNTFTDDLRVASLSSKMATHAAKAFVVADTSKIGRVSTCNVLRPGEYDRIITNRDLAGKKQDMLAQANVSLELC